MQHFLCSFLCINNFITIFVTPKQTCRCSSVGQSSWFVISWSGVRIPPSAPAGAGEWHPINKAGQPPQVAGFENEADDQTCLNRQAHLQKRIIAKQFVRIWESKPWNCYGEAKPPTGDGQASNSERSQSRKDTETAAKQRATKTVIKQTKYRYIRIPRENTRVAKWGRL